MKPWKQPCYTDDELEEIAEIFKHLALERYTPDNLCDQEMIEHAHWIFELTNCIRLGVNAPDYASWRKVVFVIPNE